MRLPRYLGQINIQGLHLVQNCPGQDLNIAVQLRKMHHASQLGQDMEALAQVYRQGMNIVFIGQEAVGYFVKSGTGGLHRQGTKATHLHDHTFLSVSKIRRYSIWHILWHIYLTTLFEASSEVQSSTKPSKRGRYSLSICAHTQQDIDASQPAPNPPHRFIG
jgi:hypothetical protein